MATHQITEPAAVEAWGGHSTAGNVAVTATIPAVAGKTAQLTGFDVTGGGATAATIQEISVTGLLGGTIYYDMPVVAGITANVNALGGYLKNFPDPLPASGANTAIVVTVPALGSGNTNVAVVAYGFYK